MRNEDGHAVGDGHGARDTAGDGEVAVGAGMARPAVRAFAVLEELRAVNLSCTREPRGHFRELGLQRTPACEGLRGRLAVAESVVAGGTRGRERLHADARAPLDLLSKRTRLGRRRPRPVRPTSTRRIFAPSAPSRSSMRSYPRSICSTLLIVLGR